MGVKYSAQESQELIQAMTNNLQVANEVTDRLSSGCDHLISSLDSGELTGAAYTAGKGLFTEIIIPSIKKLQAAIDDIQLELTSYKNADAQVSGYGDLDLDQLKELKKIEGRAVSYRRSSDSSEGELAKSNQRPLYTELGESFL